MILFHFRLKETADKLNRGIAPNGNAFSSIKTIPVNQCVVSHSHIALLLEVSSFINQFMILFQL